MSEDLGGCIVTSCFIFILLLLIWNVIILYTDPYKTSKSNKMKNIGIFLGILAFSLLPILFALIAESR